MKNKTVKISLCSAAFILISAPCLWAANYVCPSQIQTEQKLSSPVSDWHVFRDQANERYLLERIALYDGPPEEHASLVPDNEDHAADVGPEWTFNPSAGRHPWLVCIYQDTSVMLSRELPASTRKCQVGLEKEPGHPIQPLQCQ